MILSFISFSSIQNSCNIKNAIVLLIILFTTNTVLGQQLICSNKDKIFFKNKISTLKRNYIPNESFGETLAYVGKTFLDTQYVAKTLEIGEKESLVINFQGLDCTTYVENILAFSLMLKNHKRDFDSFTYYLEKVRYKNGKLNGYASRLHYFTEWITDNEKKGFIKNITGEIGGTELEKSIDFMSTHRDLYPFLKTDDNYNKIIASEKEIKNAIICYLPKPLIQENESNIQTGDIIALTTSIKGLDVTHTGIAYRKRNGNLHLMHASSKGKVVISKDPLIIYLSKIKNNTGIIVNRPL